VADIDIRNNYTCNEFYSTGSTSREDRIKMLLSWQHDIKPNDTLHNDTQHNGTQHFDTQHTTILIIVLLSVASKPMKLIVFSLSVIVSNVVAPFLHHGY